MGVLTTGASGSIDFLFEAVLARREEMIDFRRTLVGGGVRAPSGHVYRGRGHGEGIDSVAVSLRPRGIVHTCPRPVDGVASASIKMTGAC
jgi:hypothetical protein